MHWSLVLRYTQDGVVKDKIIYAGGEAAVILQYHQLREIEPGLRVDPPLQELNARTRQVLNKAGLPWEESQRYLKICDFDVRRAIRMIQGDWHRRQSW